MEDAVITVRNLTNRFGKNAVHQGLDLEVRRGEVLGVVGASGSGKSVTAALRYWKIEPEEALLAHDELDLAPGTARLKFDGGHGGQNGLRDTMQLLGHGKFHRLRIGIGHPGHKDKVTGWVLGKPGKDDEILIGRAIDEAIDVLPLAVAGNFMDAMTKLHTSKE